MKLNIFRANSAEDLTRCLSVRRSVFIEEQKVSEELEVDGKDTDCIHFLCLENNVPIATLRMMTLDTVVKIQRVAVISQYRGTHGVGRTLMKVALSWARENHFAEAILGAQIQVVGFYDKIGFVVYGDEYEEAGIRHRNMRLVL